MADIKLTNGEIYRLAKKQGNALVTFGSDSAHTDFIVRNDMFVYSKASNNASNLQVGGVGNATSANPWANSILSIYNSGSTPLRVFQRDNSSYSETIQMNNDGDSNLGSDTAHCYFQMKARNGSGHNKYWAAGVNAGDDEWQIEDGSRLSGDPDFAMNGSNCTIKGSLTKGSGTFKIIHPDPNKKDMWLKHSFVESPTAGDNIYRWQIEVVNGTHEIELPDYYKHLNENDQVWITPYKHFGQAWGEVDTAQTKLHIHANADGLYNILLIGTRKDEIATKNWEGCEVPFTEKDLRAKMARAEKLKEEE